MIEKIAIFLLFITCMLFPSLVYACGVCIDYQLDFWLPFLKILIPVFIAWLLIKIILRIIGKLTAVSIPSFITGFRGLFIIGLFIAVSYFSMISLLLPFLIVVIPSWFISIYKSQKKLYFVQDRKPLQNILIYSQWIVIAITLSSIIYSFATFTSTKRLLSKLDYLERLTLPAQKMLIEKGREISSEIIPLIEDFNVNTMNHRNQYLNLMKVVRGIDDPSLVPVVTAKFQGLEYIDDFYITEVLSETAKTLIVLDKTTGLEIILQKLKEIAANKDIDANDSENITNGLIESIPENETKTIITSYQILGAPDLGTNIEAYRDWWENTKIKR